jgi:hypothetical protein
MKFKVMHFKSTAIILLLIFLFSCEEKRLLIALNGQVVCDSSDILVSNLDNIVILDSEESIQWKGIYTDTSIKINLTKKAGTDGETETLTFVFSKKGDCLKLDRGYKYYYGSVADISAVTELQVFDFKMKDWEIDQKFSGQLVYRDYHDKQIYTVKFWVEFTEDNYELENTNYTYFSDCLMDKLPIDIDLDKDGMADYAIIYENKRDIGNNPQFNFYEIKLVSLNESKNQILAARSEAPYPIIFETPFSTKDASTYEGNLKNTLDIFYEFDTPYQEYNYFLNNKLTYKNILKNNKKDYFLIKMNFGDKKFYGWINFKFDALNCDIKVLETYLNPIETKHISLES